MLTEVANHEATRSLEFALFAIAIAAVVVRRMLKTRETLENISPVLLNLITTPPPSNVQAVNIHVFSYLPITAASFLKFCSITLSIWLVS